jgi:hypothetical protein
MAKKMRANPYDPTRPAEDTFVSRKDLLSEFVRGLSEGNSYELTGPPGIGKTNLLKEIQRQIVKVHQGRKTQPCPLPVHVECRRDHDREGSLFAHLVRAVVDGLAQLYQQACPPQVQRAVAAEADAGRLGNALESISVWAFEQDKFSYRIILLLDALHRVTEKRVLARLFGALNTQVDRKVVNVLLTGRRLAVDYVPDAVSDLRYQLIGHRDLGPLDEAETQALLDVASRLGWSADGRCAQEAYRLTGGHPYRLQYYLHAALAQHGRLTGPGLLAIHTQNTVAHLNKLLIDSSAASASSPVSIFVSYSHRDESEKQRLMTHLGVLGNAHQSKAWCDDLIGAGADWNKEILRAIDSAKVAVLLITSHFLTSDFILKVEVPRIQQRLDRKELRVVPIIGRHCAWEQHQWLSAMNVRPKNATPIWRDRGVHADEELTDVVNEIAAMLKSV